MTHAADQRGCDYCGLPVADGPARWPWRSAVPAERGPLPSAAATRAPGDRLAAPGDATTSPAPSEPRFCCYGCRFASGITAASGADGQARWMMTRLGLAVFFSMNVMVFTLLLWSQPADGGSEPAAEALYGLARHLCLLLTVPVLLLLGGPLLEEATAEVRRGRPSLNLLLVAGVAAAFAISVVATWRGIGHVYFEVVCMVPMAVTLGRWFEASGKLRTTAALRELKQLLPDRVRRVEPGAGGGSERPPDREVALESVVVGDRLRILPGEHVATDGRIVSGTAALDERTVTGESDPVVKGAGDQVHSGTLDLDGEIVVVVTAAPGAGTLERLVDAVTEAAADSRTQRLADTVAAWFLPLILAVAVGTTVVHAGSSGLSAGVMAGLAVVVVACPCALGLATPMALWAAAGSAARRHVLVRDGDALDRLAVADAFCFDKTGTLTTGARVVAVAEAPAASDLPAAFAPADPWRAAAGLAVGSTHVHAAAVAAAAAARGIAAAAVSDARTTPGRGVAGDVAGVRARLGSPQWAVADAASSVDDPVAWQPLVAAGWGVDTATAASLPAEEPRCLLTLDGRPGLAFWIAEDLRAEAAETVGRLRERGRTIVLSGDRSPRTAAVAGSLGMEWQAPLLPAEKLAAIAALQAAGSTVVMVGDGINDAPALAAADVGIALGCGADVSRWSAAICLLRDDLAMLPWLLQLAGRTRRTIRWNLVWAFGYNAVCVPLAAAGLVHPAVAAAAMVASSLLVVGNSLRLAEEPA